MKVRKHPSEFKRRRGKKREEIRGLARYKNPKASSLAPDPTDNNFVLHGWAESELSLQNSCFSSSDRDNRLCPF